MKIILLILTIAVSLTLKSQTYYVVRHAEKVVSSNGMASADDPPLTTEGAQRALALKEYLKDKNIGFIFSTNTLRTISTAKPASEASGVKIKMYNKSAAPFIDSLRGLRKNTLIVGHSNTVDDIANALSGAENVHGDLPDDQYDNLYIITINGSKVLFKAIKFGKPSSNVLSGQL